MRFLLDMGIGAKVCIWLNANGHNALHLNDEKLFRLPDSQIIEKAILEKRVVLTADLDFGQLLSLNHFSSVSVIQFRVSDFSSQNIISKLDQLFSTFEDQLHNDFLITVEDKRIRYRKLPI